MGSERMTSVHLPESKRPGLADWGRKTPEEMITQYRAYALHMREEADKVLAAPDSAFHVETYIGQHKRRQCEVLQDPQP